MRKDKGPSSGKVVVSVLTAVLSWSPAAALPAGGEGPVYVFRRTAARPAAAAKRKTSASRPGAPRERAPSPASSPYAGKRDPFKIPEPAPAKTGPGGVLEAASGALPPGNRGLLISQLRLEGVVRQATGMLAVVTNQSNRAYFLREGDAVYNGVVSRITPDAVFFRENFLDENGRVATRDAIKRLGAAPGEGR